ncbi:unnamed protein product [Timema podura]|uniref:AH domain-containing protein n=1 Tax=Timema podura TaxID=61482 RepID=A0ABN7P8P7_TIMPD|nr:unnamed protein product [Timema podura]
MIQSSNGQVIINYNKLHADPQQGKTLDIVLKKVKHRLVENMSTATADALGLSRAILCNDTLVKKLEELEQTESMYRGLVEHAKRVLKAFFDILQVYKASVTSFGDRDLSLKTATFFRNDLSRFSFSNGNYLPLLCTDEVVSHPVKGCMNNMYAFIEPNAS